MAIEQANNQGESEPPTGDSRSVELAVLRLGDVLAEIARDSENKAGITTDASSADEPSTRSKGISDGEKRDESE